MQAAPSLPAFSKETISAKRSAVRELFLRESSHSKTTAVEALSGAELRLLFNCYDDQFFSNQLGNLLGSTGAVIFFEVSTRMTSAGANISHRPARNKNRAVYRIAVSAPVLYASFRKTDEAFSVNGLVCADRLQALLVLVEHELVHLYEMLTSGASGHAKQFKKIALDLFGHTDFRHALLSPSDQASSTLGFGLGDLVAFTFNGRRVTGMLNRITKRATVLVADRNGRTYDDGRKYLKFYVPLTRLVRVQPVNLLQASVARTPTIV